MLIWIERHLRRWRLVSPSTSRPYPDDCFPPAIEPLFLRLLLFLEPPPSNMQMGRPHLIVCTALRTPIHDHWEFLSAPLRRNSRGTLPFPLTSLHSTLLFRLIGWRGVAEYNCTWRPSWAHARRKNFLTFRSDGDYTQVNLPVFLKH